MKFALEQLTAETLQNPKAWIGVDLDGTTAQYTEFKGWKHIGDPVPKMVERIKKWLDLGIQVKILTARISPVSIARNEKEGATVEKMIALIKAWCKEHIGQELDVVAMKDCNMLFFCDDSAVQIAKNTGEAVAGDAGFRVFEDAIKKAIDQSKLKE